MRHLFTAIAVVGSMLLFAPINASAQDCTVCDQCVSDGDCASGEVCHNFGGNVGNVCTQSNCTSTSCPGDSVCYEISSNGQVTGNFCLNPDANVAWCSPSYTCYSDGQACSGLGVDCASGAEACLAVGSNLCLGDGTTSWCSCGCSTDADCGAGNTCITTTDGSGACMPGNSSGGGGNPGGGTGGLCEGINCGVGQVCDSGTGKCVDEGGDLCAGVQCPNGGICSPATGTCIGGTTPDPNGGGTTDPEPDPDPNGGGTTDPDPSGGGNPDVNPVGGGNNGGGSGSGTPDTPADSAGGGGVVSTGNSGSDGFDDGGCSVAPRATSNTPLGFGALVLFGLVALRLRRRRD